MGPQHRIGVNNVEVSRGMLPVSRRLRCKAHLKFSRLAHTSVFPSGLPWWLRWLRFCLQCRRPRFSPWVGKIPWRRARQPTPVFVPGESHGQRSLGSQRVGHDWATQQQDIRGRNKASWKTRCLWGVGPEQSDSSVSQQVRRTKQFSFCSVWVSLFCPGLGWEKNGASWNCSTGNPMLY